MKKNGWSFLFWLTSLWIFTQPAFGTPETAEQPALTYVLSMPRPQTHYFEVEMRISGGNTTAQTGYVDVKMPVWTPGSYLIREYAKNVEGFRASAGGQAVRSEKISKNTWRVYSNADLITVTYKVYAFELSVRTSFIDESHGYLNGASVFMYVDPLRNRPHRLIIEPYAPWKQVSTGLPAVGGQTKTYEAPDYDILVDSPVEIGNHRTFSFTAAGIPHTVALYGDGPLDEQKVASDMKKVCETATTVIGEHPCSSYTFIIHQTPNGGGGLEHLNSTTLQVTRAAFTNPALYTDFLSLVAHEYFHLWNVKRIRPKALGPFDYERENYTHLLWVSEGITSTYQTYLLLRARVLSADDYLKSFANGISGIENDPGNRVQSVAESSWDAWIKYYRPNENSTNSTVSYYEKGSVLGGLLNLTLIASTNGRQNLDDLMRLLYATYYKKLHRGFTDEEFQQAAEQLAGRKLDPFFRSYVFGTEKIDYPALLAPVGLQLVDASGSRQDAFIGAATRYADGKLTVSAVRRDSPAWNDGLNVNDEILAINNVRVGNDLFKAVAAYQPGDTIEVLVNRGGSLKRLAVRLTGNPLAAYRITTVANPTAEQRALLAKWLYTSNP